MAGLAVTLGAVTWLLVPFVLPVKLPEDFPQLPDLKTLSPGLRASLESADEAARKRPGSAETVGKLGMAYHANMFFEQGERAYRIAARLDSGNYQWAYYRALLQEENGNEKEQVKFLEETLRLKPDYVPALMKLGDSSFKVDRLDEATRYYEMAARADASVTLPATLGLGRVAARRQDWGKVIKIIAPLSIQYSYVLQPHELLLEAYAAAGQADKAAAARQNMALAKWKIVPPPEDPLNEQLIGLSYSSTRLLKHAGVLSRVGQPDRAIQVARRAAQADPADPEIHNYLARTLLTFYGDKADAIDEALTQIAECLRLKPEDRLPLWGFTDEFFKTPKPPAAVERLSALLRPYAHLAEAHYPLALVADAQGNTAEAVLHYQAALKDKPNNSTVYNKLGQISHKARKFDEAIGYLRKAVQLSPSSGNARLNLGIVLMERGNYGQAVNELSELLRQDPHDADARFCMGFALMYTKRVDDAVSQFREGLRYKPDDPDAHYGLASALYTQGRREEAMAEVRQALKLRRDFPAAQELLQQLER